MNIIGMGLVFSGGRGVDAFRRSLQNGWRPPQAVTIGKRDVPAFLVDLDRIQDKSVFKKLRRADKLSKMAVLAATDAVLDSGLGGAERSRLGVIVATAFGAHVTTFEFLDGVLDYGEAAVSPTVFSNSVHNAAASYISSVLGIQGPTLTVTRFFFSFQSALQLADAWLREGRLEHVLVGAVDQFGDVIGYISQNRLSLAGDGKIGRQAGTAVPGEGAAFFVLSRTVSGKGYCSIGDIRFGSAFPDEPSPDFDVLDADGLIADQSVYSRFGGGRTATAVYAPVYGSMMVGSAFSVAAAGLMIKGRTCFPDPLSGSVPRCPEDSELTDSSIDFVRCIRYNCSHYGSSIDIGKTE
jgi:3-oxoacyl-[acyl-carrier-protein] synthase II